jgi:hypothetical protein
MKRLGTGWKPFGPNGFPGRKEGASPKVQLRINGLPSMSCRLAAEQQSALIPLMRPERAGASMERPISLDSSQRRSLAPRGWRARSENRVGSQAQAFTGP